jgi:uncharacterized protein YozE (UPF0346 family)
MAALGREVLTTFVTSFYPWLLRQADRADPVGDVARAAKVDPAWPKRTEALPRLDRYLTGREATVETRQALRRAYGEWLLVTAGEVR